MRMCQAAQMGAAWRCGAVVTILSACAAIDPTPTSDEVTHIHTMPQPASQDAAVHAAKAWLQTNLKDPESARYGTFRQPVGGVLALPTYNRWGDRSGVERQVGWFMCGEVNSKNSYGGYVGMEPFLVWFDPNDPTRVRDGSVGGIVGEWCGGLYGY